MPIAPRIGPVVLAPGRKGASLEEGRSVKMASVIGAQSSSLHVQTVRRHADAMLLMQHLVFVVVVFRVYVGIFAIL
jgi:hypothetical protein